MMAHTSRLTDDRREAAHYTRSSQIQVVSLILANESFGVDIMKVQEIIKPVEITPTPNAPKCVRGVIDLRGQVIPVLEMRERFGMPSIETNDESRILIVEIQGKAFGLIVDQVSHVLTLSSEDVAPPPPLIGGINREFLLGVARRAEGLLLLLDLDRILPETLDGQVV